MTLQHLYNIRSGTGLVVKSWFGEPDRWHMLPSQHLGGRKSESSMSTGAAQYVQAKMLAQRGNTQVKAKQSTTTSKGHLNRLPFKNAFSEQGGGACL